jgi:hypothetical protein
MDAIYTINKLENNICYIICFSVCGSTISKEELLYIRTLWKDPEWYLMNLNIVIKFMIKLF